MSCKKLTQRDVKNHKLIYISPTSFLNFSEYCETVWNIETDFFEVKTCEFPVIIIREWAVICLECKNDYINLLKPKGFDYDILQTSFIKVLDCMILNYVAFDIDCKRECGLLFNTLKLYK